MRCSGPRAEVPLSAHILFGGVLFGVSVSGNGTLSMIAACTVGYRRKGPASEDLLEGLLLCTGFISCRVGHATDGMRAEGGDVDVDVVQLDVSGRTTGCTQSWPQGESSSSSGARPVDCDNILQYAGGIARLLDHGSGRGETNP